ncbi:MAG: outer membrane protein assembly factor BamD [Lewinella sp.]|nr:outer membrane protein assembly factor BamD [Lewinella sp.]
MKHLTPFFLLIGLLVLVPSCKSEFEKIRTSGDPALMLGKADTYFENEDYQRAQTLYELVIASFRGRQEAELISFNYAYTYYHLRQYILAAYYFKNFAQTFGASEYREEAEFMTAYSNYQLSPNFRLDQTYTQRAIEAFQEFVNQYPNSERVTECNRLIDEMRLKLEQKEFSAAELYFDLQQYQAAIRSYENLLIEFPDTRRAEEVRFRIIRAAFLLAENSFVERQTERYQDLVSRAETFLARYTESEYRGDVQEMLTNSQDRLKQLEDDRYQK